MGILRLYMTLAIVSIHSNAKVFPWAVNNGLETLELFFLISGFYMGLIATKYKSAAEFYVSRGLRILVPYYVILAFVIVLSVLSGLVFGHWLSLDAYAAYSSTKNSLSGVIVTALTNLTVFFQDWIFFLKSEPGSALSFTAHYKQFGSPLYLYLLIQPAWSISIELMFYLLVPFLARLRSRWLVGIALVSLAARIYTYQVLGLVEDPFGFRFFPFELLLFVMGMLSFRVYERTLMNRKDTLTVKTTLQYVLVAAVMIALGFALQRGAILLRHPVGRAYAPLVSYIFWLPVIPIAFHLTRNWKLDRFLGEITYSIYLSHFVIIQFVDTVFVRLGIPSRYLGVTSALLATGLAILLYTRLFEPFERKRGELARAWAARWRREAALPKAAAGS
jgi:peptidoglycan/LPS O-acetylase OafA/YrhL